VRWIKKELKMLSMRVEKTRISVEKIERQDLSG